MINRRQLLRYGQMSLFAALGTGVASQWQSADGQTPTESAIEESEATPTTAEPSQKPNQLSIKWLGHSCFVFAADGLTILVNPFEPIGCTAGYRLPRVQANLVLISSQLLDEGSIDELLGKPQILFQPGSYQFRGKQIEGVRTEHDRQGGRRFGINVTWKWTQAGIKILHLGGVAAPITTNQRILMGRPDLLLLPVGGGPKAYNAEEAKAAIELLKPKVVIPTLYRTEAADEDLCDIAGVDEFLSVMENTQVEKVNSDAIALTRDMLPETGPVIKQFQYQF